MIKKNRIIFNIYILNLICTCIFISFMPITAHAAENKQFTLSAGKSYELTSTGDKHSYIGMKTAYSQAPKYDYVHKDLNGVIESYGSAGGSFTVSAGGKTTLTVTSSTNIVIEYDAELISVKESAAKTIYRHTFGAGKTIEISNKNIVLPNSVMINGTTASLPKYDLIYKDMYGNITAYESEIDLSNIKISPGGSVVITAGGSDIIVYAPQEWAAEMEFNSLNTAALRYYSLSEGKSLEITSAKTNLSLSVATNSISSDASPKYDYVLRDSDGNAAEYGSEDMYGEIKLPQAGSALVTSKNSFMLKIWTPSEWAEKHLTFVEINDAALYHHTLAPNFTAEITNKNKNTGYMITTNSTSDRNTPKYDYVCKDGSGNIINYGSENIFNSFYVDNEITASITSVGNYSLEIWFPGEWLKSSLTISEASTQVLHKQKLQAGKSLIFNNSGYYNTYNIQAVSSGQPALEYTIKDSFGRIINYAPENEYEAIPVESRSTATVTAKGNDLVLWIPSEWMKTTAITISETSNPAILYRSITSGQGLKIHNSSDMSCTVSTNGGDGSRNTFDYLVSDNEGNMDYKTSVSIGSIPVPPGGYAHILVSKGSELKTWFPYEWSESILTLADAGNAVFSYTLKAGNTIELSNSNKNYAFTVSTNSTSDRTTPKYDYVLKDSDKEILDYGSSDLFESFTVVEGGSSIITARKGSDLKILFPMEWSSILNIKPMSEPALRHYTVAPGKTLEIINSTNKAYNIKNNSDENMSSPSYDYTYKQQSPPDELTVELMNGVVPLRINSVITVKAVNGYDLRLWFPYEWTKIVSIKGGIE